MPALFRRSRFEFELYKKHNTYLAGLFKGSQSVKTLVGLRCVVPVGILNVEDDTVALFYKLSAN